MLREFLNVYKKKTILLSEIENAMGGNVTYEEFAAEVNKLVEEEVLQEVNPKNNNGKSIPLCMKYKINRFKLNEDFIEKVKEMSLRIDRNIYLDDYYKMSEKEFEKDKKYIELVYKYIKENGLPKEYVTSPERSFNITGDEKWIDEKDGRKLLQRLKIYDKLRIMNISDPLMFAVNGKCMNDEIHYHLIVENKATFLAMMDFIGETKFTSLILGYGWKITGNVCMLKKQMNFTGKDVLYYFGDLDNEGISIYSALDERIHAVPAAEFYKELLKKPYSRGKESQSYNENAVKKFLEYFDKEEQEKILYMMNNGMYMPQEALDKTELRRIFKEII